MKKNKIKDTHELQSYFVTRVNKIIQSKGKKMIGWDEILEGGLTDDAAVMSWRGMKGGIEAAKKGHKVVMSPTTFAYLDYTQGDPSLENVIYASLSLEKAYSFEPVPENVNADLILGGQGNLWAEMITTMPFAFYMVYPRAFAIAESVWTPKEKKDWDSFVTRTEKHFDRFEAANENISKAVLDPIVKMSKKGDDYILTLENNVPNTEIFYTIDNTYPAKFGEKYTNAIVLPDGNYALRAQTFRDGKAIGRELYIDKKDLIKRISRKEITAEDLVE
jgi:hexosaminidase